MVPTTLPSPMRVAGSDPGTQLDPVPVVQHVFHLVAQVKVQEFAVRLFGPPLQQWQLHGVITPKVKWLSVTTMALSLAYLVLFTPTPAWLMLLTALVMLYGAVFILSRPSRAPRTTASGEVRLAGKDRS